METTYYNFCKTIADDFGIELYQKHKKYKKDFPLKDGKRKINSVSDSIIVDNDGNEHPYMLSNNLRNESMLIDFDYIYVIRPKTLKQIIEETGVVLDSKPCKVCEGGGWYSDGTRYYYKDITCEI